MAFANSKWRELFDQALVFVDIAVGSDHNPLILNTQSPLNIVGKPFKFESLWTTEEECREIISEAWQRSSEGSSMVKFCKKLRGCKEKLKEWHRAKFGDLRFQIAVTKDKLLEVQKQLDRGFDSDLVIYEKELKGKIEDLWQKDAMFWHQRSRVKWLQMGDRNSRFFHLTTLQRRQRNQIERLKDENGVWRCEPKDLGGIIKNHFQSLFNTPVVRNFDDIISLIDPVISAEINAALTKPVVREEVRAAVFQMGPLKAPGSDGFPGLFYQTYWDIVGEEVFAVVQSFFNDGIILREINHTNITLIPKVKHPEVISQFRPISLCRFIYKIISKVLANRLQPFIHGIISEQQSAFIRGRQIQDNIVIAHEVFHFLKLKKKGSKAAVAIQLDLNKAYDRVCWDFLLKMMEKMGFDQKWIEWVQQCVCTVKFSITVNGSQVCNVTPGRGLRQGDPLSPYLFLMVADVFSMLLNKVISNKSLEGIKMRKKCPVVSHLLFADDSLIFLEANPLFCSNFMQIASCFSEASGLSINVQKSRVCFSANTSEGLKEEIKQVLGMEEMDPSTKYLGLPAFWGKSKKEFLGYIRDRIVAKVRGWGNKQLNQAGKEVLIKSVLQTIPMYPFMCFKAPKSTCAQLNSIICNFWWENGDSGGKIHWGAWPKMTVQKGMGGMGFKDFGSFNDALLGRQFWRLLNNPNSLWAKVLKGLYFPNSSCLKAGRGATPSWIWSSLLEGRSLLDKGLMWSVGNGESIRFWEDNWIPNLPHFKVSSPLPSGCEWNWVSDFISKQTGTWDMDKLRSCVSEEEAQAIIKIPFSLSDGSDKLIWSLSSSGQYSVKSGYTQALKSTVSNTAAPSSSYAPPNAMWSRLWAIPTAPKVRMFMWKVVKNWVACKQNLFRRKCGLNPLCPICDTENESIEHTLFRCPWTKAVWFGSGKAFWVLENPITAADKWMDDLLCGNLAKETSGEVVAEIFQLCWAIWKARNDCVFNGNTPNPEDTISRASKANVDYLQATVVPPKSYSVSRTSGGRWVPPPPLVIKFNIDGAFSSSRSLAAFGIIARDCSGQAQVWRFGRVMASSAIFIEAWALRIACLVALELNLGEVIFESDCFLLIKCLTSCDDQVPWEIRALVDDIMTWASTNNWKFVWCSRKVNGVAHWLASNCLVRRILFQSGCIPPGLDKVLVRDLPF